MNSIWQVLLAHRTEALLALAWNFSALLSAMPPLPEHAPYWVVWIHDYLQLLGANLNKRPSLPAETPAQPKP